MKKLYAFNLFMLIVLLMSSDLFSQVIKFSTSFNGTGFPPAGWTRTTILGSGGNWTRSTSNTRTGAGCAFSNFVAAGGANYLKTPSFSCTTDDSLVFYFRHSFSSGVVADSFEVLLSTTDTAVSSFSNSLLKLVYPADYGTAAAYHRYSISLNSFAGNTCYISFAHFDLDGDGIRLDDISVFGPTPPDNMGITASNLLNNRIYAVGSSYDFTATARNYGGNTQNVVPVYYTVNGGAPIGPVNTVGPIPTNTNEVVNFNGAFAFTPVVSGTNVVKIFTALSGETDPSNDTLTQSVTVLDKITSYPYLHTFGNNTGWTVLTESNGPGGSTALWVTGIITNPAGVSGDTAARCNFYGPANNSGRREVLRSPVLDLTSLINPELNFSLAYRTYNTENDTIEVLVSTNAGLTFIPAATVYNKSNSSLPSLATRPPSTTSFFPDSASQWRHESIDLSKVAGQNNGVIGFRGKSRFGNNAWIDNVVVNNVNSICNDVVTSPGVYNCNPLLSLNFITVGLRPDENSTVNFDSFEKALTNEEPAGDFVRFTDDGSAVFLSSDNPGGGIVTVSQHTNTAPPSVAVPVIDVNTTATAPDGSVYTPALIYPRFWFTVSYTGNDRRGNANYDISIDLDGLSFFNPDKLYIVKRSDMTDSWACLSTTRSGNVLTASGLNSFSDFAIAGVDNPLPVELSSFVSSVSGNNVTLNWATASEANNSGFDIERSTVNGQWSKIGNVAGNGTSAGHSYAFTDRNLSTGKYNYRLKQTDFNGNFEYFNLSSEVSIGVPAKFELSQNYPNPFNPSTKISFALPNDGKVSLKIYDMTGKEVMSLVNEVKTAGYYSVSFNASSLSSGIYFYTLSADNFKATKKMMLVK